MKLEPADTLSEEYKPEDVWIGHSYFLMQDEEGNDNQPIVFYMRLFRF